jgi:hypothetical protein
MHSWRCGRGGRWPTAVGYLPLAEARLLDLVECGLLCHLTLGPAAAQQHRAKNVRNLLGKMASAQKISKAEHSTAQHSTAQHNTVWGCRQSLKDQPHHSQRPFNAQMRLCALGCTSAADFAQQASAGPSNPL